MIDEYQDTNKLQHEIVRLLSGEKENIVAVGDDAQSIYRFRGADFRNIMKFPESFSQCQVITLEQNYRSTQPILDVGNAILESALWKYDKQLFTRRSGGDTPAIIRADNEEQQSQFIVQQIMDLREEGISLEDMAILFRSGFHSFDMEIALQKANIPFMKYGGLQFIESAHIKDVIAFLRVAINPKDPVSWNRILLLIEGIGPKSSARIIDQIFTQQITLDDTTNLHAPSKSMDTVQSLCSLIIRLQDDTKSVEEQVHAIMQFYRPLLKLNYDDGVKRQKDLDVFCDIAARYRSISSFLTDVALDPPTESIDDIHAPDKEEELLTLSTIHSAKGLEWKVVFVINALEGRFPPARAYDSPEALEEERRLMYVACTRAKDMLFVTYPINMYDRESGIVLSSPSQFLEPTFDKVERYLLQ
jgi:DNA helicase-2/ATP-dependent DNA helicase PcrA